MQAMYCLILCLKRSPILQKIYSVQRPKLQTTQRGFQHAATSAFDWTQEPFRHWPEMHVHVDCMSDPAGEIDARAGRWQTMCLATDGDMVEDGAEGGAICCVVSLADLHPPQCQSHSPEGQHQPHTISLVLVHRKTPAGPVQDSESADQLFMKFISTTSSGKW